MPQLRFTQEEREDRDTYLKCMEHFDRQGHFFAAAQWANAVIGIDSVNKDALELKEKYRNEGKLKLSAEVCAMPRHLTLAV